ncbi:MAG: HAMP domain-containing protein [Leptospira sp.]|nr:HAMP domain-containing protein [Leptospira sp.]
MNRKKEITRSKFLTIILSYFFISMSANGLVVASINFISPYIYTQTELEFVLRIQSGYEIFGIFSFLIPVIIISVYFYPLLKFFFSKNFSEIPEKVKSIILNSAFISGVVGFVGWGIGGSPFFIGSYFHGVVPPNSLLIRFVLTLLLLSNLCFVFIYYTIDFLNRKFVINYIFSHSNLSEVPGTIRLSIKVRFYIFYIAVAITPLILLLNILISILARTGSGEMIFPVSIIVLLSACIGIFLTYLKADFFENPILEMKNATDIIQKGDLTVSVHVVSNDELGNLGEGINDMAAGLREKEFIKDTFGKLVDPGVRDHLLKGKLVLGGEIKDASILFIDIRSFTTLTEKMRPDAVVDWLNRYFEKMSECIVSENGFVNKYIGDAILAVFGLPVLNSEHAICSVNAALKMRESLKKLNVEFQKENFPEIRVGIGIHSGPVLAGNIGSDSRMEYTVIGDTVNIASRLEGYCKDVKRDILISVSTKKALENSIPTEFLDRIQVRGKLEFIEIYTI